MVQFAASPQAREVRKMFGGAEVACLICSGNAWGFCNSKGSIGVVASRHPEELRKVLGIRAREFDPRFTVRRADENLEAWGGRNSGNVFCVRYGVSFSAFASY